MMSKKIANRERRWLEWALTRVLQGLDVAPLTAELQAVGFDNLNQVKDFLAWCDES